MNLLSWIVFGLIVGIIANIIDPRPAQGGLLGSVLLGILGSLLGGFLGDLIFGVGVSGFNLSSFIVAAIGSLLVLVIGRAVRRL
jgi:uncharacterized membrane protein YeaQ/YmgE (transglycosylase-associated protein family)